ncbi:uncharacterized protein LOC121297695 [Polyodon spathula]|uniref:uncharacterized protein LOC121297695 n=1 Tax=Polyodon spathula TaxID=7913 RepID=UPI001B7DC681|nr:uncharacterized protein LOC121297695 [Polyodon spathula]
MQKSACHWKVKMLKKKKACESKKVQGVLSSKPECVRKHRQDNEKRLAALQQRQNEADEQKQLIQGALLILDTPETSTSRHTGFDSEEESDGESRQTDEKRESCIEVKKSMFEESEEFSDEGSQTRQKSLKTKQLANCLRVRMKRMLTVKTKGRDFKLNLSLKAKLDFIANSWSSSPGLEEMRDFRWIHVFWIVIMRNAMIQKRL